MIEGGNRARFAFEPLPQFGALGHMCGQNLVDFGKPQDRSGFLAHFHRHGHVDPREIVSLLDDADFHAIDQGAVGISSLQYVLAKASV